MLPRATRMPSFFGTTVSRYLGLGLRFVHGNVARWWHFQIRCATSATISAAATTKADRSRKLLIIVDLCLFSDSTIFVRENLLQDKYSNGSSDHETQRGLGAARRLCCATQLIFFLANRTHGIVISQHSQLKMNISTCLTIVDMSIQIFRNTHIGTERTSVVTESWSTRRS